jgi:asparagine synthase (glutamine-hydrolysing)
MYESFISQWQNPASVVVGATGPSSILSVHAWDDQNLPDVVSRMMYLDSVSYLPGDILVKVDRASMAKSLEVRCPLLDHRVVEFAWSLPPELKVFKRHGKRLLRRLLGRYVPRDLFERPKQGFGPPLGEWLRGPLRPWAEDLLDPVRLRRDSFFRVEPIQHSWQEHVSGSRSRAYQLWNVLMFQAWHEHWRGSRASQAA